VPAGQPALAVFDLAGTTIRDRGEVAAAFLSALAGAGISVARETIAAWRGASKREVVANLVAAQRPALDLNERDRLSAAIHGDFRRALRVRFESCADLAFADAAPLFRRLRAAGIAIALNSGFDRDLVDLVVRAAGWPAPWFVAVASADDVARGRPSPDLIQWCMARAGVADPGRVAVVGDTRRDLEAAASAGVAWRIGVTRGAHDRATLEAAQATHVVDTLSAIAGVLIGTGMPSVS
jgi:phosphonatase-like hydrolase